MAQFGAVGTAQWNVLSKKAEEWHNIHIRDLFQQDRSSLQAIAAGITFDYTRQRVDADLLNDLVELAETSTLTEHRDAMLRGDKINSTENRSVLHTALRLPRNSSLVVDGVDVVPQVHEVLDRMANLARAIREGRWVGHTGQRIRHIVNIGIGGSDLGPVMAYEALRHYAKKELQFHFVSNVDGTDISEVLKIVDPLETLFIVASKTFTTQETMMNANTARDALLALVPDRDERAVANHFVALSTNEEHVNAFGIDSTNMFGFWEWVGGRYSMDSAIGLSTMIAIGPEAFSELLAGFHAMDSHFASAPLAENLPVVMGLLGVWNRSFLGIESVAVLPYDQYLKRFPAYLQQLVMESNGKSVTHGGQAVDTSTGALYWGEPGTNGQHSFYQLIHQGTSLVACDVIVAATSHNPVGSHHDVLVSNALGQAAVFAFGRTREAVIASGVPTELVEHKVMPGNRPTSVLMVDRIDPHTLGALVALYEHMTFVQGVIWGINSFDQWGVELGKEMASSIAPFLSNDDDVSHFDASTAAAIKWYRARR